MGVPRQHERYSYQDYLSWPEWPLGERWELVDGVAYAISPAPTTGHQEILGEMLRQISNYLLDRSCRVFVAPVDVKLSAAEDDDEPTVVQPDLAITCRPETVTHHGITGAPELCVEVISPGTVTTDRKRKFELYRTYGVGEYWIVDPGGVVEVYRLAGSQNYERIAAYGPEDTVSPAVLPELEVDLSLVFREQVTG